MIDWNLSTSLAVAVLAAMAFVGVLMALVRALAESSRVAAATQQNHYEVCEGFSELAAANAAMRRQLNELAQRVDQAGRTTVVQQSPANVRAYELAARLAAGGAPSDELVESCGLTPAEAELAVLVHGKARATATAH